MRWYLDGFAQRSKIKVDLDLPADFGRLSRELETAIFRVVQECLTNIHRHSGSAIAKVRLRRRDDEVLVEVEDRGKGIPPEKQDEMATGGTPGVGVAFGSGASGSGSPINSARRFESGDHSKPASRPFNSVS